MPETRLQQRRPRRHVVRVGVDFDEFQLVGLLAGERIELVDRFHLVAEQRHAPGAVLVVRRENLDGVAAHPERAAIEIAARALVLQRDQIGEQRALVEPLAALDRKRHRRIGLDRADTVDARYRGDDDDVVAFQERARRRVPHAVDLLVDRGILLDIGVGARDIGFRLVVIVIADEIFDGVVGKETPELAVELCRQRLVGREDQGRALRLLDHLRHREGLARTGHAEQHLGAVVAAHAFDQFGDRLRLVALRVEVRLDDETSPALGFFRARRPVRRPDSGVAVFVAEFGAAFAQQLIERLLAGETRNRARVRGFRSRETQVGRPHVGRDDVADVVRGLLVLLLDAERARQIGIEFAWRHRRLYGRIYGRLADVARLRRLAETARHRRARPVRLGEIGAAVERIVRRRLQARILLPPLPGGERPARRDG